MSDVLIYCDSVSKKFCRDLKRSLWYGMMDSAADLLCLPMSEQLRDGEFWANDEISFELKRGESLGLIGRNGAGKTTLLKMLSGLIKPDRGQIEIRGRVGALIALGAGFNPVLTGRENIYVNASVLGFSKLETKKRLDAIVDFAEIADFVDTPVRSYSSGMTARLGFAIATQLKPNLLLIDEVLAVGDAAFRQKCYRRLADLQSKGTSFVLVSHNHHSILSTCDHAIYLRNGKLRALGDTSTVLDCYERDEMERTESIKLQSRSLQPNQRDKELSITSVAIFRSDTDQHSPPTTGKPAILTVDVVARRPISCLMVGIGIQAAEATCERIVDIHSREDGVSLSLPEGRSQLRVSLPSLGLVPGSYFLKIAFVEESLSYLDMVETHRFDVIASTASIAYLRRSRYFQPRHWKIDPLVQSSDACLMTSKSHPYGCED